MSTYSLALLFSPYENALALRNGGEKTANGLDPASRNLREKRSVAQSRGTSLC